MKKVLYITTVSRTINAFLVPHIEMLLQEGDIVHCACNIDNNVDKALIERGVKVFNIPFSRRPLSFGNIKAFRKLVNIQKRNNYDIIHVHTPIASIYGRLLKVVFPKLKTIYTAHGYHFFKGGPKLGWFIYYPIEKLMAKFTDVTININNEDFEITKNKLKPKKCYLVKGVGLDFSKYKPLRNEDKIRKKKELGIKDKDFVVIMIAELNENKNHIQLIKAMDILKYSYPNIKVICVGEGNKLNELNTEIKGRGLEDKIVFLGFRSDINELINISDIGVLLSYREGLPRSIMELMVNGKKIISTNIRGCRDLVCNSNVGKLVEVGDFKATAMAIEEYYITKLDKDNEHNYHEFNNNCSINEIKDYDVININKSLNNIYCEIKKGI